MRSSCDLQVIWGRVVRLLDVRLWGLPLTLALVNVSSERKEISEGCEDKQPT